VSHPNKTSPSKSKIKDDADAEFKPPKIDKYESKCVAIYA
jgi:hypothetical protein